jgi:hypothetical protein
MRQGGEGIRRFRELTPFEPGLCRGDRDTGDKRREIKCLMIGSQYQRPREWKNYACPVGSSWRVDETYINVKGQWRYLYRAVDKQGQTIDFLLSKNLDKAAAVRFFKKAIGNNEAPEKITLDGSRASHQAVAELKAEGVLPCPSPKLDSSVFSTTSLVFLPTKIFEIKI